MRSPAHRSLIVTVALLATVAGSCRWVRDLAGGGHSASDSAVGGTMGHVPSVLTFAEIRPIVRGACGQQCHDGQDAAADDFVFADGADLYERLLGPAPATVPPPCQNRPLVVPGKPDSSLLVAMIEEPDAARAGCAERMPHSCPERRPCLSEAEVQLVRQWIRQGAAP